MDLSFENLKIKYGPVILNKEFGVRTETVNPRLFAAWVHNQYPVIFCRGNFFMYQATSGVWESITQCKLIDMLFDLTPEYASITDEPIVNELLVGNKIKIILERWKEISIDDRAFDGKKSYIYHAQNGMLCLTENGKLELREFAPEYHSLWRSPIKYDPAQKPNRFLSELVCSAMGQDEVNILQYYFGQCLWGRNDSQTFLILTGTPGGGKSVLVNIIEKILGRANIGTLRLDNMDSRFETSRLLGRSLLTAKDVKPDFLDNSGAPLLKALTGGDLVEVELKLSNSRPDIRGEFNVIITSNSVLKIILNSDIEAWRRRILLINYELPPPRHKISNFDDVLIDCEGSGILNWGLEGMLKLKADSWQITKSQIQKAKIDVLLKSAEPVETFVRNYVHLDNKSSFATATAVQAFNIVCRNLHWGELSERQIALKLKKSMLEEYGIEGRNDIFWNGSKHRGYAGAKIVLPQEFKNNR